MVFFTRLKALMEGTTWHLMKRVWVLRGFCGGQTYPCQRRDEQTQTRFSKSPGACPHPAPNLKRLPSWQPFSCPPQPSTSSAELPHPSEYEPDCSPTLVTTLCSEVFELQRSQPGWASCRLRPAQLRLGQSLKGMSDETSRRLPR